MTLPGDRHTRTPRDRFRNILSAEKDDESVSESRRPAVVNLPKVGVPAQDALGERLADSQSIQVSTSAPTKSGDLRRFWTVGAILSVIANLLLMMLLFSNWTGIGAPYLAGSGSGALLGMYASLEQMDRAHIRATVPVQTSFLFDATVPVKSSTKITLAKDVSIQGAHVTINTALFNIDAPANITLPAGTSLDVNLEMALPLQTSVPITVDLPVDIAIVDTDLHGAIQGLKDSIRPLLCAASPGALLADGTPICR